MREHAFDGQVSLAGVRRAEDGFDAGSETGIEAGHGRDGWMLRRGMQAASVAVTVRSLAAGYWGPMPIVPHAAGFRFFCYSWEDHEPRHVHVEHGDKLAKYWLEPVERASSRAARRQPRTAFALASDRSWRGYPLSVLGLLRVLYQPP